MISVRAQRMAAELWSETRSRVRIRDSSMPLPASFDWPGPDFRSALKRPSCVYATHVIVATTRDAPLRSCSLKDHSFVHQHRITPSLLADYKV